MEHKLPELPYAKDSLEPHISKETLDYHHDKHHKAYVEKLNELIKGTKFEYMTLDEIILSSEGKVFNNAAQTWNHTFFWNCMSPKGGTPEGRALEMINKKWGNFDSFQKEFSEQAVANFGSGWTWLVLNKKNEVEIVNTSNAENPMKQGFKPVLTLDVWEHAYYIDYRNERPKFVDAFWNVVNWDFVNQKIA